MLFYDAKAPNGMTKASSRQVLYSIYRKKKDNQVHQYHSGCLDSKKILTTIDTPPGVPGVSKNHILFFTNETVSLLR